MFWQLYSFLLQASIIMILNNCISTKSPFVPVCSQNPSSVAQQERIFLPIQGTQVRSLGQEDPLEEEMGTHSSILVWKIPWTEKAGGLQSPRVARSRLGLNTHTHTHRRMLTFWEQWSAFCWIALSFAGFHKNRIK